MALELYNSLTGEKEEFEPLEDNQVRIYSCGQTIYDDLHIGNAMAYVYWDTLRRFMEFSGYEVRHVQNITDVGHLTDDGDQGEDKVESRAKKLGLEPMELVEDQIERYFEDTSALNIDRQDIVPRATGHIKEMISYIEQIIEEGYAYESQGNVYLDLDKLAEEKGYGELPGKSISELKEDAQRRVEKDPAKKNQSDFALWIKADDDHAMKWNSPWSEGYPGWHLECSVMSQKYLGNKFDIHAGGKDHIFPHHPNERAQSKAHSDSGLARYWLHNDFVTVEGEKMSKSKGNFHTVRELIRKGFSGNAIRLNLISSHYRSETDFSMESLEESSKELESIKRDLMVIKDSEEGQKIGSPTPQEIRDKFKQIMEDDLDTPNAKQYLLESLKHLKEEHDKKHLSSEYYETFKSLFEVLGVELDIDRGNRAVQKLVELRSKMRDKKRFEEADQIRDALYKSGVLIEDEGQKTFWSV